MRKTCDPVIASQDDVEFLLWDLACVSGALSEIATVWRRALPCRPGLPLSLPVRIQGSARQLASAIRARADAGPAQPADQAVSLTEQFSALRQSIASAETMTCSHGIAQVGDDGLWAFLRAALVRAAGRADLIAVAG